MTFTCEATGVSGILFYVDGEVAFNQKFIDRGFDEKGQMTINDTIRTRQLLVHAREINNNSIIYCVVHPDYDIKSDNATLTIQGILISLVVCVIIHFFRSIG